MKIEIGYNGIENRKFITMACMHKVAAVDSVRDLFMPVEYSGKWVLTKSNSVRIDTRYLMLLRKTICCDAEKNKAETIHLFFYMDSFKLI